MVARKKRTPAVIDTNVFIRNFKARHIKNPNCQVISLWLLEKRVQLVVSGLMIDEYLGIFSEVLGMDRETISGWRHRLQRDARKTVVNLGRRYTVSRDPSDNLLLATASAGNADYLISNDNDLLELPASFRRALPFAIVTPREFLAAIKAD